MDRLVPESEAPDVEFVLVVEAGVLEYQARLLCESIRAHGGRYRDARIAAVSPRPGRRPSRDFAAFAERHAVDYIDLALRIECPEYGTANRIYAAAERADRSHAEVLIVIDSDTLFLREPDFRLDGADVAARPVDTKGICTAGEGDPFDPYWRSLCALGGIDYERLPFVTPTIDHERVRASYNGGLVAVRRSTGILQKAADLFGRSVRAGLRPRTPGESNVFASTGFVGETASAFWGSSQATLSVAIWGTTDRVRILEPIYNVPLHLWDHLLARQPELPLGSLVHAHYHWLCSPGYERANPVLDGRLPLSPEIGAWIRSRMPFPVDAALAQAPQQHRRLRPHAALGRPQAKGARVLSEPLVERLRRTNLGKVIKQIDLKKIHPDNQGIVRLEFKFPRNLFWGRTLVIETDPRPWSYSAHVGVKPSKEAHGPAVLLVKLKVDEGELGVGLLRTESSTDYALPEQSLDPCEEPIDLLFPIPDLREVGYLIFRSWATSGKVTVARVFCVSLHLPAGSDAPGGSGKR